MSKSRPLVCIGGPQHGRTVEMSDHVRGMNFPRIDWRPMTSPSPSIAPMVVDVYELDRTILHLSPDYALIAEYLRHEETPRKQGEMKFLEHVTGGQLVVRPPQEGANP